MKQHKEHNGIEVGYFVKVIGKSAEIRNADGSILSGTVTAIYSFDDTESVFVDFKSCGKWDSANIVDVVKVEKSQMRWRK